MLRCKADEAIMTLSEIASISEIVGAVGVIASLIYVGLEVRRNTTALRTQAHESMVSGYIASIARITENASVIARAFPSTYEEFSTFSAEDKMVYFSVIFGFFKHFEQMHTHYQRGLIAEDEWDAWSEHVRMQFHQPGVQWWWSMRKNSFLRSFRTYLDSSEPSNMVSMVNVLATNIDVDGQST